LKEPSYIPRRGKSRVEEMKFDEKVQERKRSTRNPLTSAHRGEREWKTSESESRLNRGAVEVGEEGALGTKITRREEKT